MNISRIFIERPIMTTLVMAALVIFGLFGYFTLPVIRPAECGFSHRQRQRRNCPAPIPSPWPRASPAPLENQFSTIPGIDQMTSSSSIGLDQHHHPVRPGPQHRHRRPGRAGRDQRGSWPACPRRCRARPASARSIPTTSRSCTSRCSPTRCRCTTWTNMPRRCWRAKSPPSTAWPRFRCSARANMACASRPIPTRWRRASIGIDQLSQRHRRRQCQSGHRRAQRRAPGGHPSWPPASSTMPRISATRSSPIAMARRCGWAMSPRCMDGQESGLGGTWLHEQDGSSMLAINRQPGSNTVEVIDKIKAILPHFEAGLPQAVQAGNPLRPERRDPRFGQ